MDAYVRPNEAVCVTTLDAESRNISASVSLAVGRQMTLVPDLRLPSGTPVKVTWSRYLVLAEVLNAQNGRTLLQIRHFMSTDDIGQIRQRWL
jgi:hypothetical protein